MCTDEDIYAQKEPHDKWRGKDFISDSPDSKASKLSTLPSTFFLMS